MAEQIIPMSDGSIPPSSDRGNTWSIKPFATSSETGWGPMIQLLIWFLSDLAASILVNWLVKWVKNFYQLTLRP